MIKINETDLVALLGENGERWVQGQWDDDDGMCLHGAIRRCSPQPGDAFIIEQVAAAQGWGTDWNDADDTNWHMIRQRLARVEVTDADLADTFGPHWEHIVAMVRRAAVLTADEIRQLDTAWAAASTAAGIAASTAARIAAWDAAGIAAGGAACIAASTAARIAAWDAAGIAAGGAVRVAAFDAAWDAARALAMRDLIGQYGFTQEHYELLTGPWRTVIGPVHPDDAPLEAHRG